jgi:hypothetical protein
MGLKLRIRKHQLVDKDGNNVVINCSSEFKASYVPGDIDGTWYDVTGDAGGLDEFKILIAKDPTSYKLSEKSSSVDITLTGDAALLVQSYLFDTPCSYLNYFDAEITDSDCKYIYRNFEMKPDNMQWCDDDGCYYKMPLREGDDYATNLKKYSIHDNWQKWYSEDGTKEHPTFHCVVVNPMPILQSIRLGMWMFAFNVAGVSTITSIITNKYKEYRDSLGFGRHLPAPLIRDIILNITTKVGLSMDTIFDVGEDCQNDCLLTAYQAQYHRSEEPMFEPGISKKFIWGNRYIMPFDEFLDEICKMYNCYWEIAGGTLYIKTIKGKLQETAIDISDQVINRCYNFDFTKKAAYGNYKYMIDGTEQGSSRTMLQYSDIVDFDGAGANPMLEGNVTKQLYFAPTHFLNDKIGPNDMRNIIDGGYNVALIMGGFLGVMAVYLGVGITSAPAAAACLIALADYLGQMVDTRNDIRAVYNEDGYYSGIIKLRGDGTINTPKIVRWDGTSSLINARAVKQAVGTIQINSYYNVSNVAYENQSFGTGNWETIDFVFNYPLMIDANYKNNLFDTYHETTDNPMIVNITNKSVTLVIPFCCENIELVGLDEDSQRIVGKIVKVKDGEYMLVQECEVSYVDSSIKLKGKLIYR